MEITVKDLIEKLMWVREDKKIEIRTPDGLYDLEDVYELDSTVELGCKER